MQQLFTVYGLYTCYSSIVYMPFSNSSLISLSQAIFLIVVRHRKRCESVFPTKNNNLFPHIDKRENYPGSLFFKLLAVLLHSPATVAGKSPFFRYEATNGYVPTSSRSLSSSYPFLCHSNSRLPRTCFLAFPQQFYVTRDGPLLMQDSQRTRIKPNRTLGRG